MTNSTLIRVCDVTVHYICSLIWAVPNKVTRLCYDVHAEFTQQHCMLLCVVCIHCRRQLSASVSIDFEWDDIIHCPTELWVQCIALVPFPSIKSRGIFNFFYFNAAQLELAEEIPHGGGTDSKHAGYLCSEQEEISLVVFGVTKKHQHSGWRKTHLCVSSVRQLNVCFEVKKKVLSKYTHFNL